MKTPTAQMKRLVMSRVPARIKDALARVAQPERYTRLPRTATYAADGFITTHNSDFVNDAKFRDAYAAGERTGSWRGANVQWRAHVACWAASHAMHLAGDFVECGVNRGGLSRTICEYVDFKRSTKKFYLLDTFRGLDERFLSEAEKSRGFTASMGGYYDECFDEVVSTFRGFPNVRIVRGAVPETLSQADTDAVAYLSIDMNCVEPEIAAAEFFWPRLVAGAMVLLDDYGWSTHILQKRAFDEFAAKRGVQILSLPTGQGLIVKP